MWTENQPVQLALFFFLLEAEVEETTSSRLTLMLCDGKGKDPGNPRSTAVSDVMITQHSPFVTMVISEGFTRGFEGCLHLPRGVLQCARGSWESAHKSFFTAADLACLRAML